MGWMACGTAKRLLFVAVWHRKVQVLHYFHAFFSHGSLETVVVFLPIHQTELQVQHTKHLCHQPFHKSRSILSSAGESSCLACDWRSGATPWSSDYKTESQDSCHKTSSQYYRKSCCSHAGKSWLQQERLHYTPVCAGFCPAHQQTNAPVQTYISTGKK